MRKIPIIFSAPYLASYLNTIPRIKSDWPLFFNIGSWNTEENVGRGIDRDGVSQMLKRLGKKAHIDKRIYPHLFRHSRATSYANRLTEQQLKNVFGWTGDSSMAATYVHLSQRDVDKAVMEANGMKVFDTEPETKLKSRICPKCRSINGMDFSFCSKCGSALDIGVALQQQQDNKTFEERMVSYMRDNGSFDKMFELMSREMLMVDYKKKKHIK